MFCPPHEAAIRLSTHIKLAVAIWLLAEALFFYLVAELIGYPEALLISFITSLFGWTLLKRVGASAAVKLRALLEGRRLVAAEPIRFADETLASLGAIALLMPGFLSDLLGLLVMVPAVRTRLAGWWASRPTPGPGASRPGQRPSGPQVIDLEPGEWQRNDPRRHPASKS